jgi:hypothetical protein
MVTYLVNFAVSQSGYPGLDKFHKVLAKLSQSKLFLQNKFCQDRRILYAKCLEMIGERH